MELKKIGKMGDGNSSKYSCGSAYETLEWIHAIHQFLTPYYFLINAHVVNFFTDRLWESVDKDWIDCLRKEPVHNLLQIPSGVVQVKMNRIFISIMIELYKCCLGAWKSPELGI